MARTKGVSNRFTGGIGRKGSETARNESEPSIYKNHYPKHAVCREEVGSLPNFPVRTTYTSNKYEVSFPVVIHTKCDNFRAEDFGPTPISNETLRLDKFAEGVLKEDLWTYSGHSDVKSSGGSPRTLFSLNWGVQRSFTQL